MMSQSSHHDEGTTEVWGAVVAEVPTALEDTLLAVVGEDCIGAESSATTGGRRRVRIYSDSPDSAQKMLARAVALLRGSGEDPADCRVEVERVEDGRWVERYQAGLSSIPLGQRFVVEPSGESGESGGRIPILLIPGRAFGTGEHPTTRLCAEELERCVQPESRWIDLGCGSGILSLVARHCGAARVKALDSDPQAVTVAREVLLRNRAGSEIEVVEGSAGDVDRGSWDGLVANISASFFVESAAALGAPLRPGGRLIASGFLEDERAEVAAALSRAGLEPTRVRSTEGWVVLVAGRAEELD